MTMLRLFNKQSQENSESATPVPSSVPLAPASAATTSLQQSRLLFGGCLLKPNAATKNFLFLGTTGSGKTVSISLLMNTVVRHIGKGRNQRALVYDGKTEFVKALVGMADPNACPTDAQGRPQGSRVVRLFNPFDARCVAWDMAKDITEPATALELAEILIPENDGDSNPFFREASRHIVYGVVLALIDQLPGEWTFRDVLAILKRQEHVRKLLELVPATQDIADTYLNTKSEKLAGEIIATIRSTMLPFEVIAGNWHNKERVSLNQWLKGKDEQILVLGASEKTRSAVDAVNQLIYTRAVQLLLDLPDNKPGDPLPRQVWFFLDEVRQMGKLKKLGSALTKGRSKGACTVLGLQDIDGLIAIYGKDMAHEILGMTSHKAILKLNSPSSAEWASSLWGEFYRQEWRTSTNESSSSQGGSSGSTTAVHDVQRKAVFANEFFKLHEPGHSYPGTDRKTNLDAYYVTGEVDVEPPPGDPPPHYGRWKKELDWQRVLESLPAEHATFPNFVESDPALQYLSLWEETDWQRLRTPPLPSASEKGMLPSEAINTQDMGDADKKPAAAQTLAAVPDSNAMLPANSTAPRVSDAAPSVSSVSASEPNETVGDANILPKRVIRTKRFYPVASVDPAVRTDTTALPSREPESHDTTHDTTVAPDTEASDTAEASAPLPPRVVHTKRFYPARLRPYEIEGH